MFRFEMITTLAICAVASNCSPIIYGSGRHSDVLQYGIKRSAIRSEIGEPAESGRTGKDPNTIMPDTAYDSFIVKGPVYDHYLATGSGMGAAMTFGLTEILNFPYSIWWKITARGPYKVTVYYNKDEHYRWHLVTKHQSIEP